MTLQHSTLPNFTLSGITWECWITERNTYEWRSTCGHYAVWRDGGACYARRGDRIGTFPHHDLISAMRAALSERKEAA
jgi:hypothetical protein